MKHKMHVILLASVMNTYMQAHDPLERAIKEVQPLEVMNLLENPFVKTALSYEEKKWYAKLAHKVMHDKLMQCTNTNLDRYDLCNLIVGAAATSLGIGVIYGANEEFITQTSEPALLVQPRGRGLLIALGTVLGAWGIHSINKGFGKDYRYQNYIKSLAIEKLLEQK